LPSSDVHLKTPREPTGIVMNRIAQPLSSLIQIRRNMETLKTESSWRTNRPGRSGRSGARGEARVLQPAAGGIVAASVRETSKLYQEIEKADFDLRAAGDRAQGRSAWRRKRASPRLALSKCSLRNQEAAAKEQLNCCWVAT
jgi:hypothetical protein